MRRRYLTVPVMGLLAIATPSAADSLFEAAFFGGDARLSDARAEGRGGTSLAFTDSLSANVRTPTQLVDMKLVTVSVTGRYAVTRSKDALGKVNRLGLDVPTIRVGMPVGRRAGFGFGFEARRSTQWTVVRPHQDNAAVLETLEREGTQFAIPFELGASVNRVLRLGAGVILERGTIRQRYLAELPGNGVDPRETREETLRSTAFRVAASLHHLGPLTLAGYFVPQHDGDVKIRVRGVALDNREDETRSETRPARWGLGGRIELPRRWSVGVDMENELWSNYQGRGFVETQDGNPVAVFLNDELTLRGGFERSARRGGGFPLRVGASWRRWNYKLQGEDVTEWGVTMGTGLFFRTPGARADLSIGYHHISSAAEGAPEESVFRLVFSVSGGERWY